MKFDTLELHKDILKGVHDAGFERGTPVQEQALPETLAGKDLIAQSQTGTGKTAVFLLTVFNKLMNDGLGPLEKPRALILVPTRELAVQVEKDARMLGRHLPLRYTAIYGGVQYEKQEEALAKGVDVVVATPGRLMDLFKSKRISFAEIEIFIIDEADRMFDMGFAPDVRYIANRLPKDKPRQTMLFSATIDRNVERLSERYMKPEPVVIEIEPEQVTVDKIDQKVVYASQEEKVPMTMALLNRPGVERVIIFTNMKRTAEMVGWKLTENGHQAHVLTGDVTQARRQKIIDGMKTGKVNILVATDVAARGLHIEGVTHVINFDLPEDLPSYVHRIGRTARAGASGQAFSLVDESHAFILPDLEKYIEKKIESEWIEDSEIPEDKAGPYRRRRPSGAQKGARSGKGTGGGRKGSGPGRSRSSSGGQRSARKGKGGGSGQGAASNQGAAEKGETSGDKPRRKRRRGPGGGGRQKAGAKGSRGEKRTSGGEGGKAGAAGTEKPSGKPTSREGGAERPGRGSRGRGRRRGPAGEKGQGRQDRGAKGGSRAGSPGGDSGVLSYGSTIDPTPSGAKKGGESRIDRLADKAREKIESKATDAGDGKGKGGGVLKKVLNVFRKK